ncbi:hypothetical protein ACV6RK_002416 [Cronobacter malonaticus]|uniref:hypothetical protein n=1 Tax=Cronobacter malonaticus TaxID=413503 RepID=UPI000CFD3DB2|nr:hypothetical protein [Cronobacter malonaticus]ELY5938194.1 hypothetical protein [Cronobacter malonaticus]ELY6203470.1 hypothetical protein [Cronobacter malonaticus]ELY6259565.1 hypothetical protein [Cronobacter malonaticus]MDT3562565.1 hypothetical protein [Cronobacter malonaticus]
MKKWLLILFLFTGALYASPYPVVTSITTKAMTVAGQPAHQWDFTQAVLEVGPAADQIVPYAYFLGLGIHIRDGGGDHVSFTGHWYEGRSNDNETMSQLAMRFYNQYTKNTSSTWLYDSSMVKDSEICMGYIAGTIYNIGLNEVNWEGSIRPGGCTIAPPATDWCKLTTPEILLDHGNLTLRNAEGDTARANVNVQCTTETAVTFNLVTDDKYVYLDEGKSEISVEDKPLNTPITLPSGNSSVTVKDYLTGVTKEGYHTGSSVLVMMPY